MPQITWLRVLHANISVNILETNATKLEQQYIEPRLLNLFSQEIFTNSFEIFIQFLNHKNLPYFKWIVTSCAC